MKIIQLLVSVVIVLFITSCGASNENTEASEDYDYTTEESTEAIKEGAIEPGEESVEYAEPEFEEEGSQPNEEVSKEHSQKNAFDIENLDTLNRADNLDVSSNSNFNVEMLVYCPSIMKEGAEYNVLAKVFHEINEEEINDFLQEIQDDDISDQEKRNDIIAKQLSVTKAFHVTIIFDENDFSLISGDVTQKCIVSSEPQYPEWTIKPIRPGKNKNIILKIENVFSDGTKYKSLPNQSILIDVKVNNRDFLTNIYMFLRDNPEYTLSSVIIPVLTYFFGIRRGRKKRKQKEIVQ